MVTRTQRPTAARPSSRGRRDRRFLDRARTMAAAVRAAGGRALIVGGWVRDRLMGRALERLDLEVYGLDAPHLRQLLESFGRVETVGESFQVYKCGDIDVSLPRRESKSGRGHRAFDVTGDPAMSIEEAARRRDFTVNAIAWDPLTGEYLDPFDGRGDIDRRLLRVVDRERFRRRQPARAAGGAVRRPPRLPARRRGAASCAAPFRSTICRPSASGAKSKSCCSRRVRRSASRSRWISASSRRCFRSCRRWPAVPQEPEWHPEGDVWVHTLQVVDQARSAHRRSATARSRSRSCSARSATTSASRRRRR